ncbi:TadE/TadG family type IV pilus assembly protein [Labrenzia sp. 011]|uniref:TadE/TadG family type IV pilus assembly protein n=1 Tax=Labrenzia sp. 011 TaxID=2171494 RepID=UPI000D520D59|nr:TadE/TadG family type IV pilus assembly protein [Labrenzia sp. 011]PVB60258.1 hypothetical protein DCO57_18400 [Labrenzia sp. 011]
MRGRKRPFWSFRRKNSRSLLKDDSGVTAVEFAFVALPFFLLTIAIIEVGLVQVVGYMVDNAVVSAARMIRTGQAVTGTFTADEFKKQICNFMPEFMCDPNTISIEVVAVDSFAAASSTDDLYEDDGEVREDLKFETGNAGEIVVMHVIFRWPMMISNLELFPYDHDGVRYLTSTMVFRNEPWE